MKRYALIVALVLAASFLQAESVWTGNAAVADDSEFPGESDIFRAASNSFPAGTILKVTNPRGGRSVDVSVVGRLESPGVFILIEKDAASTIGLPEDHVVPVRVSPTRATAAKALVEAEISDTPLSDDSDYNPVAGLDETSMEPRTAVVATPESKVSEIPEAMEVASAASPEAVADSPTVPLIEAVLPENDEIVEYAVPSDGEATVSSALVSEETPVSPVSDPIYTYEIDSSESLEGVREEEKDLGELVEEMPASFEKDPKKSVFFLMPSDPRPPESVETGTETKKVESVEVPALSPGLTLPAAADSRLPQVPVGDKRPYIQIGAYTDRGILEESAGRISTLAPGYPLSTAVESASGRSVYKLLIGPLKPAETGIVLQTARTSYFPDAFPYRP